MKHIYVYKQTVASFNDINRVFTTAQLAFHEKIKTIRIARIAVVSLIFGQIVPFIRYLATVGAFYFDEKGIVRIVGAKFIDIFESRFDLQTDLHHFLLGLQDFSYLKLYILKMCLH